MSLISKVGRKRIRVRTLLVGISIILWGGILLHLFPVWWMFATSIKSPTEVYQFPLSLWPRHPTLVAYKLFFYLSADNRWGPLLHPMYIYLKNSCIISGGTLILGVPLTALVAYSISKLYSPKWSRLFFLYCIGTLMIPSSISLIPTYLIIKHFPFPTRHIPNIPFLGQKFPSVNFFNTYWAVILPTSYSAFNFLLFKGFFDVIPDELINAARLDGASEIGIFRRIVLPLSRPVFAVVAYFTFSGSWNNFLWPLMVLQKNELLPLSVILYRFQDALSRQNIATIDPQLRRIFNSGVGITGLMTLAIVETIPVFIMFIIFREQLMKGVKLRGFK